MDFFGTSDHCGRLEHQQVFWIRTNIPTPTFSKRWLKEWKREAVFARSGARGSSHSTFPFFGIINNMLGCNIHFHSLESIISSVE